MARPHSQTVPNALTPKEQIGTNPLHAHLGHYTKAQNINRGHNDVLSTAERNALPDSAFAGPDRSYPINDAAHARNALSRGAQFASPKLNAKIKSKVSKKFPGIDQGV